MKICFILPGVGQKKKYIKTWQMEPLMIAQLAALTPKDVEISFYDDRIEDINYQDDADLVAITVETYTAKRAYAIADKFRKRDIPVLMGGYHPTLIPDEVMEFTDSVLIGEAEGVWHEIISDLRSGQLKKRYEKPLTEFPKGIFPDRSIYQSKKYVPVSLVESARGCIFNCGFCSVTKFFNQRYKPRDIADVVEDIKRSGKKKFFIVDDNIIVDINRTKELLKALIPLKIQWLGQGSIQVAKDPELLQLLRRSGCRILLIGFESLNKDALAKMNKSWNLSLGDYTNLVKKIHRAGIGIYATFVFGIGDDTEKTFDETYQFALDNKFFFAAFNHFVPFPGTDIYNQFKEENQLLFEKWWLQKGYQYGAIAFKPSILSPEKLSQLCVQTRRRFFSPGSIFYRALNMRANLQSISFAIMYFSHNFLQRKEVEMKYGIPLGEGLEKEE
ncbi:B12-binding domain-containing radical SAM protein [Candidatus Dependentiae bacterium]|nr:B12-binding domain-containing radical SAM protein [Candidatus Dependentiae bacterium]